MFSQKTEATTGGFGSEKSEEENDDLVGVTVVTKSDHCRSLSLDVKNVAKQQK